MKRRIALALAVFAVVLSPLGVAREAGAIDPSATTCNFAASTTIVRNQISTRYMWSSSGTGTCANSNSTYLSDIAITGSSATLGLCTNGVVEDLQLRAVVTMVSTTDLSSRVLNLEFVAPVTTYPFSAEFLILKAGSPVGAGAMFNHIFLACPPLGTPASNIVLEMIV